MKILISAVGPDVTAPVDPRFGRAPSLVLVDPESGAWSASVNPGAGLGQGAGIETARFAVDCGVTVVLTGALGPNAQRTLEAAGLAAFAVQGGTVLQAVEQWRSGGLQPITAANAPAHAGLAGGRGGLGACGGMGAGMGGGRSAGQQGGGRGRRAGGGAE